VHVSEFCHRVQVYSGRSVRNDPNAKVCSVLPHMMCMCIHEWKIELKMGVYILYSWWYSWCALHIPDLYGVVGGVLK
jgi:hypothetical protein